MDTTEQNEKTLLADIEGLRHRFPQTQDLYHEVCVTMFFRYGMTPTANKLYQLVRKGSMSAPAVALNRFWENLREKSRVTVSHPDLPDALKDAAGELVATLWATAQTTAHETLALLQNDAQAQVDQAREAEKQAFDTRDQARMALASLQGELMQVRLESEALRHEITALTSTKSAVESQLLDTRTELVANQARLDDVRRDFGSELEKLRTAAQQSEERLSSAETRALLEIDRERTAAIRLQKALETVRVERKATADRHRVECSVLQTQVADLRHALGVFEGTIQAVSDGRDVAIRELDTSRTQLFEAGAKVAALRAERDALLRQLQSYESAVRKRDTTAQPPARVKRRKPE